MIRYTDKYNKRIPTIQLINISITSPAYPHFVSVLLKAENCSVACTPRLLYPAAG